MSALASRLATAEGLGLETRQEELSEPAVPALAQGLGNEIPTEWLLQDIRD